MEQTSLTAPSDRKSEKYVSQVNNPPLTGEMLENAVKELNVDDMLPKYPKLERTFADPTLSNQSIGLVSFIPSSGATPDKDGIFGMCKLRGNFGTEQEACDRANYLIGNIDSYHKIYHTYVGKPFPLTTSSRWSAETTEVDIKNKVAKVVSDDIKKQRAEEKKEIDEIKERERELIEGSEREDDPKDNYITQRVKKAQLVWTYLETAKKMDEMKESIIKTRAEIEKLDKEHPEFIDEYRDMYFEARRKSGLKDDDDSFIQYLGESPEETERLGF